MPIWFDETITPMESIRFLNRHLGLNHNLQRTTHFTREEIENLFIIHYKLCKDGGPLNFKKFKDVAHKVLDITGDELYDKLYSRFDPNRTGHVPLEGWVRGLSTSLRGTTNEQLDFVWNTYDMFKQGFVTREIMFMYMKNSIVKTSPGEDSSEVVKDFVDVILKKMDADRDGKLSYQDYKTSVEKNSMLMEALGPCLPPRPYRKSLLTTLTINFGKL